MNRDTIPVCTVHDRFQTRNGRWLSKSEDLKNHMIYTKSQDALLLESPCDECDECKQEKISFEEKPDDKVTDEDWKNAYDKMLASGMFFEFHPDFDGTWKLDKEVFIKYHTY